SDLPGRHVAATVCDREPVGHLAGRFRVRCLMTPAHDSPRVLATSVPELTSPSSEPGRWRRLRSRLWRRKRTLLVLILAVAAFATSGWRYRVTRPDYRLACGEDAVRKMDWKSADYLATRLEATGHANHAHLLRAEVLYAKKLPDLALEECNLVNDDGVIGL